MGTRWPAAVAAALLAVALVVPIATMRFKSATFDEVSHLPAGYTYLTTGIIKLNVQHPPLVKQLCALPLLFMSLRSLDRRTLETKSFSAEWEWAFGRTFLFSQDADRILFWGRVPAVLLSVALGALVWWWSGRLWGEAGALVSLALVVLDPTITAHGQLVTTDVGCALFSTVFVVALRAYVRSRGPARRLAAGAALGLALGAKYSAVVLLPVALLLLGASRFTRDREQGRVSWRTLAAPAGEFATIVVVAWSILWVIYGFPRDPLFYVAGLREVNADHARIPSYLMGQLRVGGWVHYLAVAALVKTPLPALILLGAAAALAVRRWRALGLDDAFLLVPAVAFFAGYSVRSDNFGIRYLIPCLPFVYVFAGRVGAWAQAASRRVSVLVVLLLCWSAVEYAAIAPDHLSYFNQIAGGWRGGIRWLADSNVDWGQGLIQLRSYLQREGPREYWFCYFGSAVPQYYGIRPLCPDASSAEPQHSTLIVSAHQLAYWYGQLRQRHGEGPGNWVAHRKPKTVVGHAYYVYEFP